MIVWLFSAFDQFCLEQSCKKFRLYRLASILLCWLILELCVFATVLFLAMCININLCCKPHVIPSEVGDPQQHVAPFKAVKVKLLRVDLLHHLQRKNRDSRGETKSVVLTYFRHGWSSVLGDDIPQLLHMLLQGQHPLLQFWPGRQTIQYQHSDKIYYLVRVTNSCLLLLLSGFNKSGFAINSASSILAMVVFSM